MPSSKRKHGANGDFSQALQSRGLAGIHPFDLYGLELSSGAPLAACRGSPVPELKNLGAKKNKIPNMICELLEERHGHVAEGCNDDKNRLLSLNNASQYLQFSKRSNNETARLLRFWISSVTVQNYSRRWSSCNNPGCDRAAETGVDPIGCVAAAEPISESANPSGVSAEESAIIISSDESSHSEQDKIAANKEPWICICSHEAKTLRRLLRHGKHCERVPESARAKTDPIRTNQCQYGCAVERAVSKHERRTHYICLCSGNITLKRYALQSSEPIDPVRYFLHAQVEDQEQRSDNLVGALQGNAKPCEAEKLYKLDDSEIAAAARLAIEQHYKEELPFWNASTNTDKDLQSYQHAPVAGPSPRKEAEHSNNHVPPSETSPAALYIQQASGSGATSPAVTESDWPVSEQTGNSPVESDSRATSVSSPRPSSSLKLSDKLNRSTNLVSPTSVFFGNSPSEEYDQDLFLCHLCSEDQSVVEPLYTHTKCLPPAKKLRLSSPIQRTTEYLDLMKPDKEQTKEDALQLNRLLDTLRKKKKIVVIAGAGISVSAGLPDFRSSTGLFANVKRQYNLKGSGKDLFDASVYKHDDTTEAFHTMLREIASMAEVAVPTQFHHLLASLANEGRLLRLYSQNIDCIDTSMDPLATHVPLKPNGPWPTTIQLHGGLRNMNCTKCNSIQKFDVELFNGPKPPLCPECKAYDEFRTSTEGKRSHGIGRLRPRIVLYNERNPDEDAIGRVWRADVKSRPDAVVVVGTTLKVPGARDLTEEMCQVTQQRKNGICIWINMNDEPKGLKLASCWDMVVRSDCDSVARLTGLTP